MKIKAQKLTTNLNTYRTPLEDLDELPFEPIVGAPLMLMSSVHESGGIVTSPVEDVQVTDTGYIVETKNSVYILDLVDEEG
jgi:hypothetical protein